MDSAQKGERALCCPAQTLVGVAPPAQRRCAVCDLTLSLGSPGRSLDQVVSVRGNQERYRFRDYRSPYTHEVMLRNLSPNNTLYFYQVRRARRPFSAIFARRVTQPP